jgi:hypothetical protein
MKFEMVIVLFIINIAIQNDNEFGTDMSLTLKIWKTKNALKFMTVLSKQDQKNVWF